MTRSRPDDDRSIAGPREARIGESLGGGSPLRRPDDDRSIAGPREARIGESLGGGSPLWGPDDDGSIAGPREARIGESLGGGSPLWGSWPRRQLGGGEALLVEPLAARADRRERQPVAVDVDQADVVLLGAEHHARHRRIRDADA